MFKVDIELKSLNMLIEGNVHSSREIVERLELKNSTVRWVLSNLILAAFLIESYRVLFGGYRLDKDNCENII